MAVEDGCALGILLGLLSKTQTSDLRSQIPSLLKEFEAMRKKRTTTNVQGAVQNRRFYHMEDGPEREARDADLREVDWDDVNSPCPWRWANLGYLKGLMAFDTIEDARSRFQIWKERNMSSVNEANL